MGETTVSDLQLFLARGNELARHLCALLVCTEFAFLMFAQAAHSSGSDSAATLISHTGEILEKRVCEITRKHSTGDNTETYECELPRTEPTQLSVLAGQTVIIRRIRARSESIIIAYNRAVSLLLRMRMSLIVLRSECVWKHHFIPRAK